MIEPTDENPMEVIELDIAEEGTILGDFQKERTAAITEMFDNEDVATGIYPTSAFFVRLDAAVQKAIDRAVGEALDEVDDGRI